MSHSDENISFIIVFVALPHSSTLDDEGGNSDDMVEMAILSALSSCFVMGDNNCTADCWVLACDCAVVVLAIVDIRCLR